MGAELSPDAFRAIFEHGLDAIVIADDSERLVHANRAACMLLGATATELSGKTLADLAVADGAAVPLLAAGERRAVFRLRRGDGTVSELEAVVTSNISSGLHMCMLRGTTEPQAARRAAADTAAHHEALEEAKAERRRLVESLAYEKRRAEVLFHGVPISTYAWQHVVRNGANDFVLSDVNSAARAISGPLLEALIGSYASAFFHDQPEMRACLEQCHTSQQTFRKQLTVVYKNGTRRLMNITFAPAPPDIVLAHAEDISEQRRLEDQLRQAQKMEAIGRLAGGIAHDFNNVLTVISSYSALNLQALKPGDPLHTDLREINNACERAVGITRQLLAFSRGQVLQPRVLDLAESLRELTTMLRRLIGEDVELTVRNAPDLAKVFADPGQIEQVLMNLVINARDAMPTGGKLVIETQNVELDADYAAVHVGARPGHYVMLAVSDTGVGIDAETKAQIFEPFFTTKPVGKGTGLGLAMVFGIVTQSGGSIDVYSEPCIGTTFKVYLPRAVKAGDTVTLPSLAELDSLGSETILLVEDDDAVRKLVRKVLQRAGYHVIEAANGGEALLLAEQYADAIDLLLTDVIMPRMSGRQLVERITTTRAGLRVIYMSGYTDDAMLHHGVVESGVPFIQKPVSIDTLLRTVRRVLDGPKMTTPR
jgi:PAS domain S-box-containing protein